MIRNIVLASLFLSTASVAAADCVILLHGMARGKTSFAVLELVLNNAGYHVVNNAYPSTIAEVEVLADIAIPRDIAECGDKEPVHFITHSLGGIVLRAGLERYRPDHMGRVVMLAPPNGGSELIDAFSGIAIFDWYNGPASAELRSDIEAGSLLASLPRPDYEVGVIAGYASLNPLFSNIIEGADDGKVSVVSTVLPGMVDHLALPVGHTYLMNNPLVIAQIRTFLEEGQFDDNMTLADALLNR